MTFDKIRYNIDNVICIAISTLCIALALIVACIGLTDITLSQDSITMLTMEALIFAAVSIIGIKLSGKSTQ